MRRKWSFGHCDKLFGHKCEDGWVEVEERGRYTWLREVEVTSLFDENSLIERVNAFKCSCGTPRRFFIVSQFTAKGGKIPPFEIHKLRCFDCYEPGGGGNVKKRRA